MNLDVTSIDWVETLVGEQLLLGLLGKILYSELDRTWLQTMIDEDVFAESPFGGSQPGVQRGLEYLQGWSQENLNGISEQSFLDLRVDYTHMFVGLERVLVPMWESVYFSKQRNIFQEETLQVRNWYRRFGLEPEKLYQEPDDHIGLEFAFLAHLAQLGTQALEEEDERRFQQLFEAQRAFFKEHLGTWVLTWCGLVEQHAKTNFYKGLASLTRGAVIALSEIVEVKPSKEIVR